MKKVSLFLRMAIGGMLGLLCLSGCSQEIELPPEEKTVAESKIQIGLTFDSFIIERWQRDRDVFVSTAKQLGAEVNIQNANGSVEEQISQIEYFIDKKVDVIVIVAVDSNGLEEAIQSAKKAGIKVVAYDRLIMNSNVDLYISFDNEEVGRHMAEAFIKTIPEDGKVVMINGPTTDNNVACVDKGFEERIKETNIEIVDTIFCEGWRSEKAFDYVNDNLETIRNIQGIMCGNDSLAGLAIRALSERRLAGEIMVVGQDADLDACQRVVEGTQLITVFKPIEKLAQTAAEYAVWLTGEDGKDLTKAGKEERKSDVSEPTANHEKDVYISEQVEESGDSFEKLAERFGTETANDGKYDVPYIKVSTIPVNKENIDKVIIESGFHLKEDVYLNVPSILK